MGVRISNAIVKQLIAKHIKDTINKDNIVDMIVGSLDSTALESFVGVCISDKEYVRFNIDNIVSFEMKGTDNLRDHNLLSDKTTRYGHIYASDNYGDDYNPFHYKMNVRVYDLDEDDNIISFNADIYTNELTHVDQDSQLWLQLNDYKQTIKQQ